MEYTIPIHGIIGSPERKGDKNQYFTYNDFLMHLAKSKNFDTIMLDIASDGGYCDVADKMITKLQETNKTIAAFNSGNVASAATKLFTTASKELRVYYPQKGLFLIHNPWASVDGDANDFMDVAIALKETELEYVNWYSQKTGTDNEIISALMSENVALTPSQVEELGFASVVYPVVNAFAKLKNNNTYMEDKVIEKLNIFEKLINKLVNKKSLMIVDGSGNELVIDEITEISELAVGQKVVIGGDSKITGDYVLNDGTTVKIVDGLITEIMLPVDETIVAVMFNDKDGNVIDFPELAEGEEIVVGLKVLVNGEVITGSVFAEDGSEYIIVDGILTEMKSAPEVEVEVEVEDPEMVALKSENETLKAKITELEGLATSSQSQFEALAKEFKEIKALASNHKIQDAKPETIENKTTNKFSFNREKLKNK